MPPRRDGRPRALHANSAANRQNDKKNQYQRPCSAAAAELAQCTFRTKIGSGRHNRRQSRCALLGRTEQTAPRPHLPRDPLSPPPLTMVGRARRYADKTRTAPPHLTRRHTPTEHIYPNKLTLTLYTRIFHTHTDVNPRQSPYLHPSQTPLFLHSRAHQVQPPNSVIGNERRLWIVSSARFWITPVLIP